MRASVLLALLVACSRDESAAVDAAIVGSDADVMDAPFMCRRAVTPPPACLALAPSTLQGTTPFGTLDLALEHFAAGDCLTISGAHVTWSGACGEQLRAQFSYPVDDTGSGRRVTGSFDADAYFEFRPPGLPPRDDRATIHVDVTTWQEGQDMHDIDVTLTITDARYAVPPLRVAGTFCDWPYYLC